MHGNHSNNIHNILPLFKYFYCLVFLNFLVLCGKFRLLRQPQEATLPIPTAIFPGVQTTVRLPVLELRVLTCAQMLMHVTAHRGWTITNTLSEPVLKTERKNPLPHWGIKSKSVLHMALCPNILPTELSRPWNAWVPMECKGLHLHIFWQNRQGKLQTGYICSALHTIKLGNSVSSPIPTCLAALPWASHLLCLILDGTLLVCCNFASHSWWNNRLQAQPSTLMLPFLWSFCGQGC